MTDFSQKALDALPDNLKDFLDTPIPTVGDITNPSDVDAAIIAQGQLAYNLNTILQAFGGLPFVRIYMHIAQLNDVSIGQLISSLECFAPPGGFSVLEPKADNAYLPGDVRLQVRPTNGTLQQVAVEISGGSAPIALEQGEEGHFWGFARLEDTGPYTATFTGLFANENTETKAIDFTISLDEDDDPDLPDGDDTGPLEEVKRQFDKAYQTTVEALSNSDTGSAWKDAARQGISAARKLATVADKIGAGQMKALGALYQVIDELAGSVTSRSISQENQKVLTIVGRMKRAADQVYSEATQRYFENNPHPKSGYASSPTVLSGAKDAMNEKYGPGTVEW